MGWTDLSGAFGYGTKLTSAQMQQLRDNAIVALQGGSFFSSETELVLNTATTWTTMLTFPFVCPEGNDVVHLFAMLKCYSATVHLCRARIGVDGSYSANYGEREGNTYIAVDCDTHDISGLTPGTLYEGEVQLWNSIGGGSADVWIKELFVGAQP